MPLQERLGNALSENLLTLLAHSDEYGRIIHALLDVQLLEGNYRILGERFADYWRQYREAPKLHAADLFDDIFVDKNDRRGPVLRRMLKQMIALNEGINAVYVLRQLQLFTRQQSIKDAILKAADILARPTDTSLDEVEQILYDITKARAINFEPGIRLDDLGRIEAHLAKEGREFRTGIWHLDQNGIVPARGRVMLMIGGKGRGKSWFLVNCGRRALDLRHKVVHISLENSEEETALRYWQAIWAIPKHPMDQIETTLLKRNRSGEVIDYYGESVPVEFDLQSPALRYEMETRLEMMAGKIDNLKIKYFNNGQLTLQQLEAYLDLLERVDNFIPDMLIVDYPRLMKIDIRNPRMSIGQNMIGIKALCGERNMAGVVVDQLSREGHRATVSRSTNVGEDWSQVLTGDTVMVHSMTDWEQRFGLGRLYVEHSRNERDKFGLLLTHNYRIGQFCIDSSYLPDNWVDDIVLQDAGGGDDHDSGDEQQD